MLEIEDVKKRCDFKQNKVEEERAKFVDFKKQIALNAVNSRSGKFIPPKVCVAGVRHIHMNKWHNNIHNMLFCRNMCYIHV